MRRPLNEGDAFPLVSRQEPNGSRFPYASATCGGCGASGEVRSKGQGLAARLFRREGWHIASRRSGDLCPDCNPKNRKPKEQPIMKTEAKGIAPAPVPTPAATPPREATVADNRRIRQHLDEVYDDEAGRYRFDGSDHKSAELLKLPRAWVSRIRDLYGPDRSQADEAKRADLAKAAANAKALTDRLLAMAQEAESIQAELERALEAAR